MPTEEHAHVDLKEEKVSWSYNEDGFQTRSKKNTATRTPAYVLRRIVSVGVLGLVVLLLSPWIVSFSATRVPKSINHTFGVGFDLTSPYGTAAISYPNGTTVNIAKVNGATSYKELISKLSLWSSRHLHRPYDSIEDIIRDRPRQLRRSARKMLGLPASSDVGELAGMINGLRAAVEKYLGRPISAASITIPHLYALYQEDLEDAFEYLGLIYLDSWPYWQGGLLSETAAAYVGNGFGLCPNYTDIPSCDDFEHHHTPDEEILAISFTTSALISTMARASNGFANPITDHYKAFDFTLGFDPAYENEYYWAKVRDMIRKPIIEGNLYLPHEVKKVFLHGECAGNEKFQVVAKEAVESLVEGEVPVFVKDPVFSPARAAAMQAMRIAFTHNATDEHV